MKDDPKSQFPASADQMGQSRGRSGSGTALKTNIGDSIDRLVEYLVHNNFDGIYPLIMGEVEKRLLVKALEKSRGNKVLAAKWLGLSRNTFHRKISKLIESRDGDKEEGEA